LPPTAFHPECVCEDVDDLWTRQSGAIPITPNPGFPAQLHSAAVLCLSHSRSSFWDDRIYSRCSSDTRLAIGVASAGSRFCQRVRHHKELAGGPSGRLHTSFLWVRFLARIVYAPEPRSREASS